MVRPSVHPIEAPPLAVNALPRATMKDVQGMPGTFGGLALRFFQFVFAVVALVVMTATSDFPSVTAFRYSHRFHSFSFVLLVLRYTILRYAFIIGLCGSIIVG